MMCAGSLSVGEGGRLGVVVRTDSAGTARRVYRLLEERLGIKPELRVAKRARLGPRHSFELRLDGEQTRRTLGEAMLLAKTGSPVLGGAPPEKVVSRDCCRRAFLRGAFLMCGTVLSPEKQYHLELVLPGAKLAAGVIRMMGNYRLRAKITARKRWFVVYLKESESIADCLSVMGAHEARLEVENVRIVKGLRNDVNRAVNFETANLNKTVDAGGRQAESIEYLISRIGADVLPEKLRELAELRVKNREITLAELGELLDPPMGKSGVNHRLRRLEAMADSLRKTEAAQGGEDVHGPQGSDHP